MCSDIEHVTYYPQIEISGVCYVALLTEQPASLQSANLCRIIAANERSGVAVGLDSISRSAACLVSS